MMPQLTFWLFAILLLAAPVVVYDLLRRQNADRREDTDGQQDPDGRWRRAGAWAAAHVQTVEDDPDDEQLAADLAVVLRRERLIRDLQRVQHLVTTDTWMSAVRQIGNRIAYEQLLHDLEALPEPPFPGTVSGASGGWATSTISAPAATAAPGYGSAGRPTVETIDVRLWR